MRKLFLVAANKKVVREIHFPSSAVLGVRRLYLNSLFVPADTDPKQAKHIPYEAEEVRHKKTDKISQKNLNICAVIGLMLCETILVQRTL